MHTKTRVVLLLVLIISCVSHWKAGAYAQEPKGPPQPTEAEAKQLIEDGDRLVDQADYIGALEHYTQAYHAIVSKIRGQSFEHRVLPNLLTRDELGKEMLEVMEREYSAEELALLNGTYHVLGLMSKDVDAKELITKLLTEEVAGFYDPEKKRMVMIRESKGVKNPSFFERLLGVKPAFDPQEQKTTLAHEMTHALQDQLYDLRALQKRVENDDDMSLALQALVEGDATLVMFAEADPSMDIRGMDPEALRATFSLMSWMLPVAGGATYRKAPAIFRESLVFPYFQGMIFCIAVAGRNGWPAVHSAYDSPPTSTEQILHPDKYKAEQRDDPQSVKLPEVSSLIAKDWKHLGGNCLGEFQTSVLLRRVASGKRASAGWDGDRYEVFEKEDGHQAICWVSVWDTEQDAQEFANAFQEYRDSASKTHASPKAKTEASPTELPNVNSSEKVPKVEAESPADAATEQVLGTEKRTIVRKDQVWIVEGFSHSETEAIIGSFENVKLEPKLFPK